MISLLNNPAANLRVSVPLPLAVSAVAECHCLSSRLLFLKAASHGGLCPDQTPVSSVLETPHPCESTAPAPVKQR